MTEDTVTWPRTASPPLTQARIRSVPEDFTVEELAGWTFEGQGEHLWVRLRKRGWNTEQAAGEIARLAGLRRRDVGYAGLKDRHAVTTQWLSLHLLNRPDPDWSRLPSGLDVVEQVRHTRKLRTGALDGNRFGIVLRDCAGDRARLERRLGELRAGGAPNYFGEQRFGRDAGNIERARATFEGRERAPDRHRRGLYLSAARSYLFNAVLARRVADGHWDQLLPGEAVMLDGSHSFFVADEIGADLRARCIAGDVHPSGPLWGRGEPPARGAAHELEQAVANEQAVLARGLERAGLRQERRALRLRVGELAAEWLDAATLRIAFTLPAGGYATTLLRELAVWTNAGRPEEAARTDGGNGRDEAGLCEADEAGIIAPPR